MRDFERGLILMEWQNIQSEQTEQTEKEKEATT